MSVKCANSLPRGDGKPGPCRSGEPAAILLTVSISTDLEGGAMAFSRNEAAAPYCRACATAAYSNVVESAQGHAKAHR